jgi:hypothetical protein
VQRFRAALNFLPAISRYHDADSLFLENFSLIRVRKFPVRQGHRFKETSRVTKPSWKLEAWGRAHVSLERTAAFPDSTVMLLVEIMARAGSAYRHKPLQPVVADLQLAVGHVPSGHLSRIARGVGTHPNRSRQDSRGHPARMERRCYAREPGTSPALMRFAGSGSRRGYAQSLRIPAACPEMPQSCQDGEIFSAPGDTSQHGCRLGNTRQRSHKTAEGLRRIAQLENAARKSRKRG